MKALQAAQGSDNFIAKSGEVELDNEQVDLLRTLHSQCPPALKKIFVPILLEQVTAENARLVANSVMRLGKLADLNSILLNPRTNSATIRGILDGIDEKLQMEAHSFTDSDLDSVEKLTGKVRLIAYVGCTATELFSWEEIKVAVNQDLDRILQRVSKIRYLRLKQILLEGESPEINTDKQLLVSRLETLGFRKEITEALHDLDRKLYQAGTPLDFKGCMDLVRTIYEEIIQDAAKSAALKGGQPPPAYQKQAFNPWNQYLRSRGILTADEQELTQKLYNYLSNAGAHRLGSDPEQARITKNMVIELGLMIVGRIQNLTGGS